jgi:hypothetical protein
LRKVALGIYNGVSSFVTHFEQSRGFTISQWHILMICR